MERLDKMAYIIFGKPFSQCNLYEKTKVRNALAGV